MSVRWILPGMGVDYTLEIEGRVVSVPETSGGARGSALWLRPPGSSLQSDVRCRGQGLCEVAGAFHRCEVPGAVDVAQVRVDEEVVDAVGPGSREQRVVFWPEHRRRHCDSMFSLRPPFGYRSGDRAGTGPVPTDLGGERARLGVYRN